jgi:hypothetical protein
MNLLTPEMSLSNRYSIGGYRYPIEYLFWVWIPSGNPVGDNLSSSGRRC